MIAIQRDSPANNCPYKIPAIYSRLQKKQQTATNKPYPC